MGAQLCIRHIALCKTEELSEKVANITAEMAFEDGHSYSGTWASAEPGVQITDKRFETVDKAEEYIDEKHEKWERVMAVQALTYGLEEFPKTAGDRDLQKRHKQLYDHVHGGFMRIVIERAKDQKSLTKTCSKCQSKIAVRYINSSLCPVCQTQFLLTETDLKRMKGWGEKLQKLACQIRDRQVVIKANSKDNHKKYIWVVGGWCSE